MGSGIAQVCAEAGYQVLVREVDEGFLKKGLGNIERFLAKGVEKGKVTPERKAEVLGRLKGTTDLGRMGECDLVIEVVTESLDVKRQVFQALDAVCRPEAIFASNTSSLSITEMAATTKRPSRFVGLHFFNPVPLMKLVEVVRVDIDEGMRLGCGHPMGPLTLLDFVGLDTTYSIANIMFDEFREKRFAPPPLLKRMVQAGLYGRKTGRGFYDYSQEPPRPVAGLV